MRPLLLALLVIAACAEDHVPSPRPDRDSPELALPERSVAAAELVTPPPPDEGPVPERGQGGSGGEGGGAGGAGGAGGQDPVTTSIALVDVRAQLGGDPDGERSSTYTGLGGGVALVDLDADGDLDLLLSAELGALRAFVNDGEARFRDATAELGLGGIQHAAAFALGDCDGDGALEILVSRSDPTVLLRRAPGGTWAEVPDAGLGSTPQRGLSAQLVDLDGDGHLDVIQSIYMPDDGRFVGEPARVFRGDGSCRFERLEAPGLEAGMGIDLAVFDADDDGDPDVLTSNDYGMLNGPLRLHENLGGTFRATPFESLIFGMGVAVADLDHDGRLDVYVTNIARNPWYRNTGPLQLEDRSREEGIGHTWYVDRTDTPRSFPVFDPDSPSDAERRLSRFVADYATGRPDDDHAFVATAWSASVVDLDADGWLDLLLSHGKAGIGLLPEGQRQRVNVYQRQAGVFRDVSPALHLELAGTFKGTAAGDLDGDGLPDVAVFGHRFGDPAPRHRVLRNDSRAGGWVRVELEGRAPNTWGIGALVRVDLGDHPVVQQRSLHAGAYSASADAMFFGIGGEREVDVEVTWPWNGGVTVARGVTAGSTVRIRQED